MEIVKSIWDFILKVSVPCIAFWAAWIARGQLRAMRASSSGQLLVNLWNKFDGPEMRTLRKQAATNLKKEGAANQKKEKSAKPLDDDNLDRLLSWFEMLGSLVYNDAILLKHAEEHFRYWIWNYWQASKKQIEGYRENNSEPKYYNHFQWLVAVMAADNKKATLGEMPNPNKLPVKEAWDKFLDDESNIDLEASVKSYP